MRDKKTLMPLLKSGPTAVLDLITEVLIDTRDQLARVADNQERYIKVLAERGRSRQAKATSTQPPAKEEKKDGPGDVMVYTKGQIVKRAGKAICFKRGDREHWFPKARVTPVLEGMLIPQWLLDAKDEEDAEAAKKKAGS